MARAALLAPPARPRPSSARATACRWLLAPRWAGKCSSVAREAALSRLARPWPGLGKGRRSAGNLPERTAAMAILQLSRAVPGKYRFCIDVATACSADGGTHDRVGCRPRCFLEDSSTTTGLTTPSLDPALIPASLPDGLAMVYRELGALVEMSPGLSNDQIAPFATQDSQAYALKSSHAGRRHGHVRVGEPGQLVCPMPDWGEGPTGILQCGGLVGPRTPRVRSRIDSLNHFLTTLCLQEAVMGCRTWSLSDIPATRSGADRPITAPLAERQVRIWGTWPQFLCITRSRGVSHGLGGRVDWFTFP